MSRRHPVQKLSGKRQVCQRVRLKTAPSDTSAAIIAAACAERPPQTRELRIIDRTGRQVFKREAAIAAVGPGLSLTVMDEIDRP